MGRRASIAGVVGAFGIATACVALAAPGQIDGSFGNGGKVLTDLGGVDWSGSIAIAPSRAAVVAGGSAGNVAVALYDPAGRLDPRFGGRGAVVTDLGGEDSAGAVVVQPDGKVVVAGQRDGDVALVRYSAAGVLDPSFDGDGIVVTDLGSQERSVSLLRRRDGRLVVLVASADKLVLARYLGDGRLDSRFGRRGTVMVRTPGLDWREAVQRPDGTIVVAGARVVTRPVQAMGLAVARFRPDGSRDRTFAGDGLTVTSSRPHWSGAVKVAVRGDGRIILGTHGHNRSGAAGFALVRLRRNGSLDKAFGVGGISVSTVGFGVHAMGIDRRGRIVTAGRTTSLQDFVVARFLSNGRRDRTFAATVTDFGGVDTPFALAIQADGKIVAAGASSTSGTLVGDIAVARYLSR